MPNYPLKNGGQGYVGHPALADPTFAKATTEVLMREAMTIVDGLLDGRLKPSDRHSPFFQVPFFRTNFWRAAGATAAVAGLGLGLTGWLRPPQEHVSDLALLEPAADGVLRLTLNRPDALNALNRELTAALEQALERVAAMDDVRVLVICGRGRAFCAGNDIREMETITGEEARGAGHAPGRADGSLLAPAAGDAGRDRRPRARRRAACSPSPRTCASPPTARASACRRSRSASTPATASRASSTSPAAATAATCCSPAAPSTPPRR